MSYTVLLFSYGLVVGMVLVSYSPSPCFAALGLVMSAGMGCGVLALYGVSFLSLVLFMIYLGGMLVVFAYSVALATDAYPQGWGKGQSLALGVLTIFAIGLGHSVTGSKLNYTSWITPEELDGFTMFPLDVGGVALMYSEGGGMLFMGACVLLLTLFVVLELTRGQSRGSLRMV